MLVMGKAQGPGMPHSATRARAAVTLGSSKMSGARGDDGGVVADGGDGGASVCTRCANAGERAP
jgi:hypothetical protein